MSDRMTPIPFDQLMHWILTEKGSTFGIKNRFQAAPSAPYTLFGSPLELPFGPAAGPHTQLAQNIIAAYIAGARFFELKTVQTLDGEDLPVSKPCIYAPDECYNVEWSTELTVPEAFDEYTKAWFALKLLAKEWDLGDADSFIFNMSVGYDLEGIHSPKIDGYIENLKDASKTPIWKSCSQWALDHLYRFSKVDAAYIHNISPQVSHSITLSTLHGCPPAEIERIATHLITQKQLHTYIKCNPTLLGYDFARQTMDQMGYDYLLFDDHHFNNDLGFDDAVPMLQRLQNLAASRSLSFGVKLTNTFPVKIGAKELPGEEMYMSGRSLFPLTISVAKKLADAFGGSLPISFSGGADAFNIGELLATGIYPITLATTLLKPGGYSRLTQIATQITAANMQPLASLNVEKINTLAHKTLTDDYYRKPIKPLASRKRPDVVPLLDCTFAPCTKGCPIAQDIPEYIRLCGEGKYLEALRVIVSKNPLPFMTGTICNHRCMDRCRRNFYETSVAIRDLKLLAATEAFDTLLKELPPFAPTTTQKVAIIGGGPAGLAAAYFLGKAGVPTTIFEKRESLGGIVRHIVPAFRIATETVENDVKLIRHYGVQIQLNHPVHSIADLESQGFDHVILAIGADKPGMLHLEEGETLNVLHFLERSRREDPTLQIGKHVIVIGGGNTAMDAARAAKRTPGVESVSLVYRRTKRYMPADQEELTLALEDGVVFRELLTPIALKDGLLRCQQMVLGSPDASGRRSPVPTDTFVTLPADCVIAAVGEAVDDTFFSTNALPLDAKRKPLFSPQTHKIQEGVFAIGDCAYGPATVVEAIRDANQAANAILEHLDLKAIDYNTPSLCDDASTPYEKKGLLHQMTSLEEEPSRCLSCDHICECCCDVCPNRANIALKVNGHTQILHIDRMCNECGNCTVFCPYNSSPYKEKFTLFHTAHDFHQSTNEGLFVKDPMCQRFMVRLDGQIGEFTLETFDWHSNLKTMIATLLDDYAYLI
ncbi:MAG: putative selenate reductase subunit YgfK [Cellulosilyticaceae bacterium]